MFTVQQKRDISDKVQAILRETDHPELPEGEIQFHLHVKGAEGTVQFPPWTDIKNNEMQTELEERNTGPKIQDDDDEV